MKSAPASPGRAPAQGKRAKEPEQSRVEKVLEAVKERLGNGTWKAGDRLPNEDELTLLLHVSRTPLREAIKILDVAGVLEIRRGTGTFVRDAPGASLSHLLLFQRHLSRANPQALMELRRLFERSCAELAASRRTDRDLAAMRAAIEDMRKLCVPGWRDLVPAICATDKAFHRSIYAATHNEPIATIASLVLDMVSPFMMKSMHVGSPLYTVSLHEILYSMIERGNSAGAREVTAVGAVDVNLGHFLANLETIDADMVAPGGSSRNAGRRHRTSKQAHPSGDEDTRDGSDDPEGNVVPYAKGSRERRLGGGLPRKK